MKLSIVHSVDSTRQQYSINTTYSGEVFMVRGEGDDLQRGLGQLVRRQFISFPEA